MKWLLIGIIRFYQIFISSWTPPTCRFYPTCSNYSLEAIRRFGAFKGSWLTIIRLGKCNPFHSGGIDHVPMKSHRHEH